jgi:hypothetical protein
MNRSPFGAVASPSAPSFLRGSQQLAPAVHIVQVETRNGAKLFRRVSLTAPHMAAVESRLMELQHLGEIRSYLLAAANDTNFSELMKWLEDIGTPAQQGELINISQDTLFSGGVE